MGGLWVRTTTSPWTHPTNWIKGGDGDERMDCCAGRNPSSFACTRPSGSRVLWRGALQLLCPALSDAVSHRHEDRSLRRVRAATGHMSQDVLGKSLRRPRNQL